MENYFEINEPDNKEESIDIEVKDDYILNDKNTINNSSTVISLKTIENITPPLVFLFDGSTHVDTIISNYGFLSKSIDIVYGFEIPKEKRTEILENYRVEFSGGGYNSIIIDFNQLKIRKTPLIEYELIDELKIIRKSEIEWVELFPEGFPIISFVYSQLSVKFIRIHKSFADQNNITTDINPRIIGRVLNINTIRYNTSKQNVDKYVHLFPKIWNDSGYEYYKIYNRYGAIGQEHIYRKYNVGFMIKIQKSIKKRNYKKNQYLNRYLYGLNRHLINIIEKY